MEAKDDYIYVNEILELAHRQPKNVSSQLNRSLKYRKHFEVLCLLTAFAPFPEFSIAEKIWLLLHEMKEFPKCRRCGKSLDKPNNFIGLTRGFHNFCSCECSANSKETASKRKATVNRIYGTDNVFQNEYIKAKSRKSCFEHFGVEISTLNHSIMKKQRQSCYLYKVDKIAFDSSLECCFYVYNKDHSISCEYAPQIKFKYEYDGKTHWYFPDFMMSNGTVIEIKGLHFFSKDGKMICPFRKKEWSDETYEKICGLYEAKHQCMLMNNVVIMTENELSEQLAYMKSQYGTKWRNLFQLSKQFS